jgi:hypothetical protein
MDEIKIKCQGADVRAIDELIEFQGKTKRLPKEKHQQLRNSILKNGFCAPVFVWDDGGQHKILDGHQRLKVLLRLREEGYNIPLLPVDYIYAETEKEARQKWGAIASQYGEWVLEELTEFTADLEIEDFSFADGNLNLNFKDFDKPEKEKNNLQTNIKIAKNGDIFKYGNCVLVCDSSEGKTINADLLFFDPMFDAENIYSLLPLHETGKKLLLFYDFLRCGDAVYSAISKGWPFNYEFILDGCTSWYVPGRPLERHKGAAIFGLEKWDFEKSVFDDGKKREDSVVSNERGKYQYEALDVGKHLSTVERWSNAGTEKEYKYEKPIPWLRAILNGCVGVSSIFDPFAGSFSAATIAIENNWSYTGYENNRDVFDIGLNKLYNICGADFVRVSDGRTYTEIVLSGENQ